MADSKWTKTTLKSLAQTTEHGLVFTGACKLNVGRVLQFETPVRFQDLWCYQGMRIGAYSFMRPAYVSGFPIIGRYCSIGANFNIGEPDHPLDWLGTTSVQYQKSKFAYFPPMADFVTRERPEEGGVQRTVVGNDVWIGSNVMILKGVKIGNGAVIAAGAVVTRDVEPYTVVGGVPAKLIRNRFSDHGLVDRLKRLRWWEFLAPGLSGVPFDDPTAAIKEIARRERAGEIVRAKPKFASLKALKEGFELTVAKSGEDAALGAPESDVPSAAEADAVGIAQAEIPSADEAPQAVEADASKTSEPAAPGSVEDAAA
ncbi:CatB-related O-acetyltransferase [Mesorhizobium sp. LHD-90]|uniref:CatB-related O-acetyltransferase n=1 Tax=Mesorhizobium sp. LHD-90 TaxID=3071414 RepID=UPI0027E0DCC1|nr:CatB-related O-acetyltransferase [Mesorhizobium sp. LHD-90]MDQ6434531.1 CatB-related O-acetyltransferase [Mesorhizobium sp. LHD-90]